MRNLILPVCFFMLCFIGIAQEDIPKAKPLKIDRKNDLDIKKDPKGTALKLPSVFEIKPNTPIKDQLNKKTINMLDQKELVQAGHGLKIDPKIGPLESGGESGQHFGNQYLGDVRSNAKFIGVVCRDHEYVDGDRVKIYINGKVADPNILLTGAFKGVNIDLDSGFNRIEFEALNEGSSSPNTAQINVYDDKGELIYSNKWLLSQGSKASLIVVKD
ncbi:hypothetical protein [Costertonia aggregata]|uniref:Secreted protein n=1 Tax=Costertonia aggregata TaxID=343403 RepID=A0A7H9AQL5_9FLAO|nr:hypothetical protein [Costertonia aggregata]QLG45723.1 hypothetical protein HYG79_10310 [Costertonia aggregata]